MCTNKTLYQPGTSSVSVSKGRRRGGRLSSKSIYVYFLQMVTGQPELSKVQVTNRLQKALATA